ncbi:MAG: T3SS effector HopA1 family protein [Candidatus Aquirickettsiella gammari]
MRQNSERSTSPIPAYPLRAQLEKICQSVQIESIDTFTLAGIRFVLNSASETPTHDALTSHAASTLQLIDNLAGQLYERCYVRQLYSVEYTSEEGGSAELLDENLTPLFHAANDNKDGWDPGWQIYQTGSDGRLFVQKGDRSRSVMAGEYSTYKWPGVAPVAGDFVSVRMFAGSTDVQPSFFFAFGRTLSDQFDEYAIVRFYFHVSAQQAPNLMAQMTACLNRYQIPFKLKALVQAKLYTRTDAAVLYIARRYFQIVAALIIDLQREELISLQDGNPLFSRTLIPGVGMAEDPKAGTSFGMHRCTLLAQGLVNAWQTGEHDCQAKMRAIEDVFVAQQLSLDRAYLNPNSSDIFDSPLFDKETRW